MCIIIAGSLALATGSWDFLRNCCLTAYHRSVAKTKFHFFIVKNAILIKESLSFGIKGRYLTEALLSPQFTVNF